VVTPHEEDGPAEGQPPAIQREGVGQDHTLSPSPWRQGGTGWVAVMAGAGLAGAAGLSIALHDSGQSGSAADWFAGIASFFAVALALWQSLVIRRQAAEQIEANQNQHAAAMAHQLELAAAERQHLLDQQRKQAIVELLRAVSRHELMLENYYIRAQRYRDFTNPEEAEPAFEMDKVNGLLAETAAAAQFELANTQMLIDDPTTLHELDRLSGMLRHTDAAAAAVRNAIADGVPQRAENFVARTRLDLNSRADDLRRAVAATMRRT
jgi:hypothetical protein